MILIYRTNPLVGGFYLGCLTRFMFSCLIDADRIDSADFENPKNKEGRSEGVPLWEDAIQKLEVKLTTFPVINSIDITRKTISDQCKARAQDPQGIYTLCVPTGGGKTLASLSYALTHAKAHQLDRVIYIIPFTSIIDQNAAAVRKILGTQHNGLPWVLEHHSNLEPEQQTWQSKLSSDNWDAPVVFTTMVQFLEANFGGGTRSVRRLHQMAKSVLIFDEVQSLPIRCFHLFNNALNFLVAYAKTTALLCTATQPLLHQLSQVDRGVLKLSPNAELMGDSECIRKLFEGLERVQISDQIKTKNDDKGNKTSNKWTLNQLVELIGNTFKADGSCLVIVNTKAVAQKLYLLMQQKLGDDDSLFHLSTHQCSAHRKDILNKIKCRLKKSQPVLCISTQLIEAGVDISFKSVIRSLAGLDSIAQAAGRCNRHGELKDSNHQTIKGQVIVVGIQDENLEGLPDIKAGQSATLKVLAEIKEGDIQGGLLSPQAMASYFNDYLNSSDQQSNMLYRFKDKKVASEFYLLYLLAHNDRHSYNQDPQGENAYPLLRQSFMQAGRAFKAIDAPTESVIVPYKRSGIELIADLHQLKPEQHDFYHCIKALRPLMQKHSVSIFPHLWNRLIEIGAIHQIAETGIYTLDERYYHPSLGLSGETVSKMENHIF